MLVQSVHHVAYRCKDAKETVEWYQKHLDMKFVLAIAENEVPSTKAPDPYMHIFLDAGHGNILAFFELPSQPELGRDENTPAWVQHLALKVDSMATLLAAKDKLLYHAGAVFATEHSANSFPNLPIRDETVFVALRRFGSIGAYEADREALAASPAWRAAEAQLRSHFVKPPETLRLLPTARSMLR